jgi:ATP-dependent helicase/nuclease subunit A
VRIFSDEHNSPSLGIKITAADKSSVESPGFKAAMERVKAAREHEFNNLFYVAMTRARNLVVASATVGSRPAGWYKTIEPFIGSLIPAVSYSALTAAAGTPCAAARRRPEPAQLRSALASLPPAPAPPEWQRIPATRLARDKDEQDPSGPAESTCYEHTEKAAARGSLAHAVLEQLALNNWEGSVADWIETLRNDFGLSKADAASLEKRIEQTRVRMTELTEGMSELRPELPFVLYKDNLLIDGTIDLLCRSNDMITLFDYKFTEVDDETAAAHYEEQMRIYRQAAEQLYPSADTVTARLVVVSGSGPRLVDLPG